MIYYKKILIALEFSPETDVILSNKARTFAQEGGHIHLIHAVEHMSSYGAAYGISAGIDIEEVLLQEAKKNMHAIGSQLNVPSDKQIVKVGPAKFVILEEAESLGADLIVVGSHGRHGVRLLLGSTSNAILHGAKCDVLAVRVFD